MQANYDRQYQRHRRGHSSGLLRLCGPFVVVSTAIAATLVTASVSWSQVNSPSLFDYQDDVDTSTDTGDLIDITDIPAIDTEVEAGEASEEVRPQTGSDGITPQLDVTLSRDEGFYTLGPGDQIAIEIFNVPEFSGNQQILVDGTISLSLIGSIFVEGLTLKQVADEIAARYVDLLERPIVNVRLQQARPITFTVSGEVERPGAYASDGSNRIRVTQAIQAAGGITRRADLRRVLLSRPQTNGPDKLFEVDLWDLLTTGEQEDNHLLLDGDTIAIATADQLDLSESQITATASFAPDEITVFLVGESNRTGQIRLDPNTPLNQAVLAAGGFNTGRANFGRIVRLIRLNPDGTVLDREYQVDFANNINQESNPPMQDNDVLIVDKSVLASVSDVLSIITAPLRNVANTINVVDRLSDDN
ncbi:MAG: polysaccharide biosynthesis/export family protein [Cyanobacteria bacterium P01_F01_bin.33]